MDPIRYLLQQLVISGKVAKWTTMLSEFDLRYIPQKAIKGRVITDLPTEDQNEETFDFPNEEVIQVEENVWIIYIDGASNQKGFGIGIFWLSQNGR